MELNSIKMKKSITYFTLFIFIFIAGLLLSFKSTNESAYEKMNEKVFKRVSDGALIYQGVINIKFKNDYSLPNLKTTGIASIDNILSKYDVNKISQKHPLKKDLSKRKIGDEALAKIYEIDYSSDTKPDIIAEEIIKDNKDVLDWAEPEYVYTFDFTPNDPYIASQWFLSKISAYAGWDLSQGDTSVVIGMVDSGSDLDHPDLAANIKYNYAENPTNGLDDDENGYIDDWRGWDFAGANYLSLSEDNDPNITTVYCEHGSHTSGCASAVTNNGLGVAGPGFKCKLLISKHGADNDNTGGGSSYVYRTDMGLAYCYQNGAKVINCSFGGTSYSSYTQLLVNNAWANGTVIVASAGNDGQNVPRYPASYDNVVSVASTNSSDHRSYFSNYHSTVDVCAPGENIYETLWNNTYAYMDGTSMSAPITSGTVALIRSKFPNLTCDEVVTKLKLGVDSIYNLNPSYVGLLGTGRINVQKCLTIVTSISGNSGEVATNYNLSQNYPNPFNPSTSIKFNIPKAGNVKISLYDITGKQLVDILNENKSAGSYTFRFDAGYLSSGVYFYKLTSGNYSETKRMTIIK